MKKFFIFVYCFFILSVSLSYSVHGSGTHSEIYTASDIVEKYEKYEKYKKYLNGGEERKVTLEEFLTGEKPEGESGSEGGGEGIESGEMSKEISEFWDALPSEIREKLPMDKDDIETERGISERFGFDFFLSFIKKTLSDIISPVTSAAAAVFGGVILSAALRRMSESIDSPNTKVVGCVICVVLCLTVFSSNLINIGQIKFFFTSIANLASAIIPVMTTLLASSGNVTGAAVNSGAMTIFCTVVEFLFAKAVVPLTTASLALSVVGCVLSENTSFSLSAFLRKFSNFITVASMTVFTFVLAVQTSLAKSADSVGVKTVKFVVGNFVPIVGGAVSETLNAVGAGISYIKTTCGTIAVIVIFMMLLPPLLSLLAAKFTVSFSSSVAEVLGCDMESKLLRELSSVTDCFSSLMTASGAVFILILTSFASVSAVGV